MRGSLGWFLFGLLIVFCQSKPLLAYNEGRLALPQWDSSYVTFPAQSGSFQLETKHLRVPQNKYSYELDAYFASITGVNSSTFGIGLPVGGCGNRATTSATANENHCKYATNAGFFTNDGDCLGNLVVNNKVVQTSPHLNANFGLRKSDGAFVLGYINSTNVTTIGFSSLVSGVGWLVKDGRSFIQESIILEQISNGFVTEFAPRTAIGHDKQGRLLLLQVDGEEDIRKGMDLYQFTDLFISLGAWNAVNLDGGGSSTSVEDGKVINNPTCNDTPVICERPVTTITCIKNVNN